MSHMILLEWSLSSMSHLACYIITRTCKYYVSCYVSLKLKCIQKQRFWLPIYQMLLTLLHLHGHVSMFSLQWVWHPDPGHNRINRILIPTSCNFFFGSRSPKNSEVKRAWPGAIWGWVIDRKVIPGCARLRTKCAEKTSVGMWGHVTITPLWSIIPLTHQRKTLQVCFQRQRTCISN